MPTLKEYNYILRKAEAWEKECHQTKICLFALVKAAARDDLHLIGDKLDFVIVKDILEKYGFGQMYNEAIKVVEKEIL